MLYEKMYEMYENMLYEKKRQCDMDWSQEMEAVVTTTTPERHFEEEKEKLNWTYFAGLYKRLSASIV